MKKIVVISLLSIFLASCMVPYSSYDYIEPTRYIYHPTYYQPTKVIIIKQKPNKHHYKPKTNRRHIRVSINKPKKKYK